MKEYIGPIPIAANAGQYILSTDLPFAAAEEVRLNAPPTPLASASLGPVGRSERRRFREADDDHGIARQPKSGLGLDLVE